MEKKQILLVEDEDALRDVCCQMLEFLGYGVVAVASGSAALEAYEPSRYDALLLDVNLPDLSGHKVLSQIHEQDSDQLVVLCSGEDLSEQGLKVPILVKPYRLTELKSCLDKLLGSDGS